MEAVKVAALDLVVAAVNEWPMLMVLLFWTRFSTAPGGEWQYLMGAGRSTVVASALPSGCGSRSDIWGSAESGDATLSTSVLSVLSALRVNGRSREPHVLVGSDEVLCSELNLVIASWQAEGMSRLRQVFGIKRRVLCVFFLKIRSGTL